MSIFAETKKMQNTTHKEILTSLKELAKNILPEGAELILFGSRARNEEKKHSDWDLLILINGERANDTDFFSYAYPFMEYGETIDEEINPIIYTYKQWNKRKILPFYENVTEEGIQIYQS